VPPVGIRTAVLEAPGAIFPVSSEPSFRTTRWTTLSAFLKTTICPPAVAGLGENDCAPFWRVTVIVNDVAAGEGDVGVDDPPPPHPAAMVINISAAVPTRVLRISAPVSPRRVRMRSKTDTRGSALYSMSYGRWRYAGRKAAYGIIQIMRRSIGVCIFVFVQAVIIYAQAPGGTVERAARTVWDGIFTDAQAQRGRGFYAEHCASCHGGSLEGAEHRPLIGDRFWATWQDTTVDRLLVHVSTNMPHSEDGSLKGTLGARVYADIVAHMLSANQFPAGSSDLTEASAAGVRIIKKDGSGELPAGSLAHVVGCLERGTGRNWKLVKGSRATRVVEGQSIDRRAPLGDREYALMFVLTPLDKFVGHRMSVRASLMGEGGSQGLNVTTIESISETCQ
jgi:cytochrome c5